MLPQRFHLFNAKMTANNTQNQQPTNLSRFERIANALLESLKQIKLTIEKADSKLSPSMLREQTLGNISLSYITRHQLTNDSSKRHRHPRPVQEWPPSRSLCANGNRGR